MVNELFDFISLVLCGNDPLLSLFHQPLTLLRLLHILCLHPSFFCNRRRCGILDSVVKLYIRTEDGGLKKCNVISEECARITFHQDLSIP